MCAGGIPTPNKTNAIDAVKAGLTMQAFITKRAKENKSKGRTFCEMRLGIHTGAVVAGVVGKNKFAYDIWGNAVNLASRMESAGEIGTVNISEATKSLDEKEFSCVSRGEVAVKNKGKVGMYIVS
ncbi:MAG: adenylate cyclase [Saprospiraceae bacterium]|jgi:adenylate cyclase